MMIKEDKVPVIYSVEPPKPKVISGPQMPVQGTKNQGETVPKAGSKVARTGLIQNPKQKTDLIQSTSPRTSLTKVPSPISQVKNKSLAVKAAVGMKANIPPKKINLVIVDRPTEGVIYSSHPNIQWTSSPLLATPPVVRQVLKSIETPSQLEKIMRF
ncbi:MAG: hypothetical protein EZS28_055810, partial [Streblomastix strix]